MKKFKTLVSRLPVKIFAIAVIVFTSACAGWQSKEFEASDRFSLLWEITGNGLQKPSYLFGTIHIYDSAIVGTRNVKMANRINDFLKQDRTLFVGLGALHLPDYRNMRGVVAPLKEKGYNLRPVLIDLNN
jgi:uncharacterized protein YbaP (TraB family)